MAALQSALVCRLRMAALRTGSIVVALDALDIDIVQSNLEPSCDQQSTRQQQKFISVLSRVFLSLLLLLTSLATRQNINH
jgi:hypothetical protein